ncbi:MAG TPA: hypothetical protein VMV92_20865 [Streptosporangiaceae bacterium]|nr:hypothetical protein [Streptosporangiaceae bacterium]
MSFYPVVSAAVPVSGGREVTAGRMIAVRVRDVASPLRGGRPVREEDRSALVIEGTGRIRTGDDIVICKVVAVVRARVRRGGSVQAQGSPAEHGTLGAAGEWLEEQAGPESSTASRSGRCCGPGSSGASGSGCWPGRSSSGRSC